MLKDVRSAFEMDINGLGVVESSGTILIFQFGSVVFRESRSSKQVLKQSLLSVSAKGQGLGTPEGSALLNSLSDLSNLRKMVLFGLLV